MPTIPKLSQVKRLLVQEAQDRQQRYKRVKIMKSKSRAELTEKEEQGLLKRSLTQIRERRLATPYGFESYTKAREITDRVHRPSMWLFHANYHARYSSREQWWVSASYLCGHSDGQDWAVRVPGTLTTVKEALHWITPAQVRKAQERGKRVLRQGDMYFIPLALPDNDFSALRGSRHQPIFIAHHPRGPSIAISHPEHPDVLLGWGQSWRAVQQKQMTTNGRRVGAD